MRDSSPILAVITGPKPAAERFEGLVKEHYQPLYRTAYRLTRSVQDAEDLVQEVCVRAFPRLNELEALEQPRFWLLRVLYRLFIDWSRRYERRNVESLETTNSPLVSPQPELAEQTDALLYNELLDRAWRRLDDHQRVLLAMHDIEGYTLAELRETLGIKEGTLKSRLHRARVRLGKLMQHEQSAGGARSRLGVSR